MSGSDGSSVGSADSQPSSQQQHQKREIVEYPSRKDVLLGRGNYSNHHWGNVRMRGVVKDRVDEFAQTTDLRVRDEVARKVIDDLSKEGCRFLREVPGEDEDTRMWEIAERSVVIRKVKQAFRDCIRIRKTAASGGEKKKSESKSKGAMRKKKVTTKQPPETSLASATLGRRAPSPLTVSHHSVELRGNSLPGYASMEVIHGIQPSPGVYPAVGNAHAMLDRQSPPPLDPTLAVARLPTNPAVQPTLQQLLEQQQLASGPSSQQLDHQASLLTILEIERLRGERIRTALLEQERLGNRARELEQQMQASSTARPGLGVPPRDNLDVLRRQHEHDLRLAEQRVLRQELLARNQGLVPLPQHIGGSLSGASHHSSGSYGSSSGVATRPQQQQRRSPSPEDKQQRRRYQQHRSGQR